MNIKYRGMVMTIAVTKDAGEPTDALIQELFTQGVEMDDIDAAVEAVRAGEEPVWDEPDDDRTELEPAPEPQPEPAVDKTEPVSDSVASGEEQPAPEPVPDETGAGEEPI